MMSVSAVVSSRRRVLVCSVFFLCLFVVLPPMLPIHILFFAFLSFAGLFILYRFVNAFLLFCFLLRFTLLVSIQEQSLLLRPCTFGLRRSGRRGFDVAFLATLFILFADFAVLLLVSFLRFLLHF